MEVLLPYPRQLCLSTKTWGHRAIWWPAVSICCLKSKSGENMGRYLVRGLWCLGNARLRSLPLRSPPPLPSCSWSRNCWQLLASVEFKLSGRLCNSEFVATLWPLPFNVDNSIFDLLDWFVNNSQLNSEFASDSGREEVLCRLFCCCSKCCWACKWFVSNSGCEWRCWN